MAAAVAVGLLFVTWIAAFHVGPVERADQSILQGFSDVGHRNGIEPVANFIANLCSPEPYLYFAWIPMLVAVLRGRPRVALAIGVILLGANLTTHLLKPLLAQPRPTWLLHGITPLKAASWPSGHATAAMSFALCAVLAAPARLRPLVAALGAAFAVAVCYSFLALAWHYPSDVLGGFLVATTWTLLAVAALLAVPQRQPAVASVSQTPTWRALGPSAAAVIGAGGLALLVAVARPHAVVSFARSHEVFVIGAAAIALVALALATGVMLAVRR
ncbi:MAG TPA: phosphatase PAP2 family protein [Solirubrobacteraceae bacterium]|nr:phosphatase PAP2 family protein [Solirubrobacteraceae bacterium]